MHQAVSCGKASSDDPLDDDRFQRTCADAAARVKAWHDESKSLASVALFVYLPLRKGDVSKAVAAQYASRILVDTTLSPEDLPSYLASAFDYMTGSGGGATCGW
jgi:hypothetical protein